MVVINTSSNNETEALVDQESNSLTSSRWYAEDGTKSDRDAVTMALPREKGRLLCSARLAVTLIAVALTLATCSVWLCLDIRAMLIREAEQVKKIKHMVEYIYNGYSGGILNGHEGSSGKNFEDFVRTVEFDYDGTVNNFHHDWPTQIESDYENNGQGW